MERFILDLDGTLFTSDYDCEKEFFKEVLSKNDSKKFIPKIPELLNRYEELYPYYDVNLLSRFLTINSNVLITKDIVKKWIDLGASFPTELNSGVVETLEYLKQKDKSLAVLTNWFGKPQIKRLEDTGIYEYFDDIYTGDMYIKPHRKAYLNACKDYDIKDCTIVGDDYEKDYFVPKKLGMNAILYHPKDDFKESKDVIKSFVKIKELY